MGLEFGNLPIRIRRILYYGLSPAEQRAWAKSVSHGIPNLVDRTLRVLPTMLPAFIISAAAYKWSIAEHYRCHRKNPKLYEHDK
ncbi:cytochrome b-c1 complex subunit 8-like [Pseudomyrmex gracilis]|uniref:cytochrome b-c1 complex subunit 8-like n=1 Tax=Pseudomyrmex gracilis TaxID=219809 RepID=UPI0009956453|nr:cytochrome b-c1 complex subunit 8-like [Pseudomyrmex gracilis]